MVLTVKALRGDMFFYQYNTILALKDCLSDRLFILLEK